MADFLHAGAFAVPETIHWAPGLPKTRSGKIMRRILRKIADGKDDELGCGLPLVLTLHLRLLNSRMTCNSSQLLISSH